MDENTRKREAEIGRNLPAGWIEQQGLTDPTQVEDNICQTCDGTGDHNGHLCKDCGGKGTL